MKYALLVDKKSLVKKPDGSIWLFDQHTATKWADIGNSYANAPFTLEKHYYEVIPVPENRIYCDGGCGCILVTCKCCEGSSFTTKTCGQEGCVIRAQEKIKERFNKF